MGRPLCAACPDCMEATAALLRVPPRRATLPGPRPTVAALERHARKFGPELVAETGAEFNLTVRVARPRRERAPRRPSLKARVRGYLAAGHGVEVIAEMEDLSASRARRLVAELQ